jgi:hypothetical protein
MPIQARIAVLGVFVLILLAVAANIWLAPLWAWLATEAAIVASFILMGLACNRRAAGILIDGRNRISLSRLQACGWTVLVLSAVAAAAAWNLRFGQGPALGLIIPQQLITAMGISLATLSATPVVLSMKTGGQASASDVASATAALTPPGSSGGTVVTGTLAGRDNSDDASWLDLFRGDEVGDAAAPDVSKIQKLLITILLLGLYTAALWDQFSAPKGLFSTLPVLSDNFVWLLGVSHAGYLLYKSAPHSQPSGGSPPAGS